MTMQQQNLIMQQQSKRCSNRACARNDIKMNHQSQLCSRTQQNNSKYRRDSEHNKDSVSMVSSSGD